MPVGRARRAARAAADRHGRRAAVRVRGRQRHGALHDRQPRGEHQRDGARRPARLLRDGARRLFLRAARPRPSALQDAGRRDRRAGGLEQRARAVRHAGAARRPTPASPSCCSPASRSARCSCCAAASRTRRGRSRRWAIPWRPAIFVLAVVADRASNAIVARCRDPSALGVALIGRHRHAGVLPLPRAAPAGRRTDACRI